MKYLKTKNLLYVALTLTLLASLHHVAFAFSTVNSGSLILGYMGGIAIDVGLMSLAAGINERKAHNRSTGWLWLGVILFSLVSTYANWLSGVSHMVEVIAQVGSLGAWLMTLRPIVLSAVLPLLLIYLTEIVTSVSSELLNELSKLANSSQNSSNEPANELSKQKNEPSILLEKRKAHLSKDGAKMSKVEKRRVKVNELLAQNMSQSDIASELKVSLATIKRDIRRNRYYDSAR